MFLQRVVDDFKQKKLLPMKLLFFIQASTLFVLYPYLTIHMRELGLNVQETAIMSALTPIVTIIMPPVAGLLADFIGNFKFLLALFSALGGLSSLLLLAVPVGRIDVVYPERAVFLVGCFDDSGHISLVLGEDRECDPSINFTSTKIHEVDGQIEACGLVCRRPSVRAEGKGKDPVSNETQSILRARSYEITLQRDGREDVYRYILAAEDLPLYRNKEFDDPDVRNGRIMKNPGRFPYSIRQLTPNLYFFPARGLLDFWCNPQEQQGGAGGRSFECHLDEATGNVSSSTSLPYQFKGGLEVKEDDFFLSSIRKWGNDDQTALLNSRCPRPKISSVRRLLSVPLLNPDNSLEVETTLNMSKCQANCIATIPRKSVCSNVGKVVVYDPNLTFWMYLVVRVFISMISGTAFSMFEGAVIAILREEKADYGLQRIYALIGGMISSPMAGLLIDYASKGKGYTDFRPAFYFYAFLKTTTAFLMLTLHLEFKTPSKNIVADVMQVLKKIEILALLFAVFMLGTAWGYIESFLFWLLQDLGASRALMGATITVGGCAGLPLLVMSGPIIEKIGHANVIFLGFIFYAVRLVGYSLIVKPWQCLIFEAMESVTSALAFTAAVTYAAKLSNLSTDSSIQGILGGIYYGVGKGAGGLGGGFLMNYYGTRPTYRILALITLVTGCLYYLFNRIIIVGRGLNEIEPTLEGEKAGKWNESSALQNDRPALRYVNEHISEDKTGTNSKSKDLKGETNLALDVDDEISPSNPTDKSNDIATS